MIQETLDEIVTHCLAHGFIICIWGSEYEQTTQSSKNSYILQWKTRIFLLILRNFLIISRNFLLILSIIILPKKEFFYLFQAHLFLVRI